MITKHDFYGIDCDNCKVSFEDYDGHSCWPDKDGVEANAMESEWHKEDDRHYCPDCASFDENGVLVIKTETK